MKKDSSATKYMEQIMGDSINGKDDLIKAIENITVHDHLCLIYENKAEQFAAVIPFMRIGLERGEKCIYIADDNTATEVLEAMRAGGIKVDQALKKGALAVITKQDAYLRHGYFDPDEMIQFLIETTATAKKDGYKALRATGEMTWMLGGEPGTERLIEYEAKLNRFFPDHDCLAMCQYNRYRFSPKIIIDVIRTHPIVVVGSVVCKNFYYVPVEEFLKAGVNTSEEVDRLLKNLLEHKLIEKEFLKVGADRYKALFLSSRDAVMTLEPPSWRFTSGNPATIKMFMAKGEGDFLTYEPWRLSPEKQPDGRKSMDKAKEMIDKAMLEGSNLFEWTHRRLDGEDFSAEVLLSKVEQGDKTFLHALVRDITERKKMEERLKEYAEEKFEIIFNGAIDGMALAEAETKRFFLSNMAFCKMLGYSLEEIKKLSVQDIHPKKDVPRVLEQFNKQMRGEIRVAENLPVIRKDGTIFYVDINSSLVTLNGKKYLLGVFRDITERRRAEEELKASELKYSTLVEKGNDGILVIRKDGIVEYVNSIICVMSGYSKEEAIGTPFINYVSPEYKRMVAEAYKKRLQGLDTPSRYEIAIISKSGNKTPVEINASLITYEGEPATMAIIRDITERQEAEKKTKESLVELEKMNKLMIGRELKMMELKKEIEKLKKKLA